MLRRTTPSTEIPSIPFWAAPSSPLAFLPSRIVFLRFFFVPSIVRPSKLFFFSVPSTTTPSTYLPGLTATTTLVFAFAFFALNEPAALTPFWIVPYLQPCLQTSNTFFACCFCPPPLASAGETTRPVRTRQSP